MRNLYEQFRQLLPDRPLQVGVVTEVGAGVVTVQLPGSGSLKARTHQTGIELGHQVFVRDAVVEALAPNLALEIIEI